MEEWFQLLDHTHSNFTSSKKLNLSFDFFVTKFGWRTVHVEIKGQLRKLENNEQIFQFFYEDLYYYLHKNQHLPKWDFDKIYLSGLDNLQLADETQKNIIKDGIAKVSNFIVEWEE